MHDRPGTLCPRPISYKLDITSQLILRRNRELVIDGSVITYFAPDDVRRLLQRNFEMVYYDQKMENIGHILFGSDMEPGRVVPSELTYRIDARVLDNIYTPHSKSYYDTASAAPWPSDYDSPELIKFETLAPGSELSGSLEFTEDTDGLYANNALTALLETRSIGPRQSLGWGQCKFRITDRASLSRVFLSYSWEDEAHNEWVATLATKLSGDGIYTIHDRSFLDFSANPDQEALRNFMLQSARKADRIVVILSPQYKRKADGVAGGVGFEYQLMQAEPPISAALDRYICVLRKGDENTSVPKGFTQPRLTRMMNDETSRQDYQSLIGRILGQG